MDCPLILSRAIHFAACLLLLAGYAVRLVVARPAAGSEGGRKLAAASLALAMGSGFLWFWVSAAEMSGGGMMESMNSQLFATVITQTPPGQVWLLRAGIAIVLAAVLCFPRGEWRWNVGAALAAALVISLAWLGHAGAGEDGRRTVMLAADSVHLVAAAFWPGGLVPFAVLLRRLIKAGRLPEARIAIRRFSAMSLATVVALAASGLINAWYLLGTMEALWTTQYGRFLILKLLIFGAMLAVGAWNLLIHKPRLETPGTVEAVKRKVWLEAALGMLVVAVVAILGTLPPGNSPGG